MSIVFSIIFMFLGCSHGQLDFSDASMVYPYQGNNYGTGARSFFQAPVQKPVLSSSSKQSVASKPKITTLNDVNQHGNSHIRNLATAGKKGEKLGTTTNGMNKAPKLNAFPATIPKNVAVTMNRIPKTPVAIHDPSQGSTRPTTTSAVSPTTTATMPRLSFPKQADWSTTVKETNGSLLNNPDNKTTNLTQIQPVKRIVHMDTESATTTESSTTATEVPATETTTAIAVTDVPITSSQPEKSSSSTDESTTTTVTPASETTTSATAKSPTPTTSATVESTGNVTDALAEICGPTIPLIESLSGPMIAPLLPPMIPMLSPVLHQVVPIRHVGETLQPISSPQRIVDVVETIQSVSSPQRIVDTPESSLPATATNIEPIAIPVLPLKKTVSNYRINKGHSGWLAPAAYEKHVEEPEEHYLTEVVYHPLSEYKRSRYQSKEPVILVVEKENYNPDLVEVEVDLDDEKGKRI